MPPDTSQGSAVCGRERISHATHATTAQAIAWAGAGRLVLSGKNLWNGAKDTTEGSKMDDASVHNLCNGIMVQAATDYRILSSGRTIRELPYETVETLAKFFRSNWAKLLCRKADPIAIFQRLQGECES